MLLKHTCQCGKSFETNNGFRKHVRKGCRISTTIQGIKQIADELNSNLGSLDSTKLLYRLQTLTTTEECVGVASRLLATQYFQSEDSSNQSGATTLLDSTLA